MVNLRTTRLNIKKLYVQNTHISFVCFVRSSEQTAIISHYIFNWIVLRNGEEAF